MCEVSCQPIDCSSQSSYLDTFMISILGRVFSNSVVVVCEKRKTMPISLSSKYRGRTAAASKQNILVSGLRMDLRLELGLVI